MPGDTQDLNIFQLNIDKKNRTNEWMADVYYVKINLSVNQ